MADRVDHFTITEGPNGSPGNFTLTRETLKPGNVTAIVIRIPRGHARKTGIQVAYSQQQIIPEPPSVYFRGNGQTIRHELSGLYPAEGDWWIQTFNADRYSHSFDVSFEVDALVVGAAAFLPPVLLLRAEGGGGSSAVPGAPAPEPVTVAPPIGGRIQPQ